MEPFVIAVDVGSIVAFVALIFFGGRLVRSYRRSKQALTESASIISVIVDALTSRIEQAETVVSQVQSDLDAVKTRSSGMEWEQASLRSSHLQLLQTMQEMLTNDKRLIADFEQLKTNLSSIHETRPPTDLSSKRVNGGAIGVPVSQGDIMGSLTPTERETLGILRLEGPKAAPELGKRLKKSREHTSRLMKKLYLEGYVDRESNRAPFRYRLTETVRSALEPGPSQVTAKASETV